MYRHEGKRFDDIARVIGAWRDAYVAENCDEPDLDWRWLRMWSEFNFVLSQAQGSPKHIEFLEDTVRRMTRELFDTRVYSLQPYVVSVLLDVGVYTPREFMDVFMACLGPPHATINPAEYRQIRNCESNLERWTRKFCSGPWPDAFCLDPPDLEELVTSAYNRAYDEFVAHAGEPM